MIRFNVLSIAMIVLSTVIANGQSSPVVPTKSFFHVKTVGSSPAVYYKDTEVIGGIQFYATDSKWVSLLTMKKAKAERSGDNSVVYSGSHPQVGNYKCRVIIRGNKLLISFDYDISPKNKVKYVLADIFLSKKLFHKNKCFGLGAFYPKHFGEIGAAKNIIFNTVIGKFKIKTTSQITSRISKPSQWGLRDASKQLFRPENMRSLTLTNFFYNRRGVRQKLSCNIDFLPVDKKTLQINKVLALLQTLKSTAKYKHPKFTKEINILSSKLKSRQNQNVNRAKKALVSIARRMSTAPLMQSAPLIIPEPRRMKVGTGNFIIDSKTAIVIPENSSSGIIHAVELAANELNLYYGLNLSVKKVPDWRKEKKAIVILEVKNDANNNISCPKNSEGYILKVTSERALVIGTTLQGVRYGIQSLLQLFRKNVTGQIVSPEVSIKDWPKLKKRWLMFDLTAPHRLTSNELKWLKQAISRFVVRAKLNGLLLGEADAGNIRWKTHPEYATPNRAVDVDDLKKIINYAHEFGLETIPLVQSLGHNSRLLSKHPKLADSPKGNALCLSDPKVKKILGELYDEAFEIYGKPKYFHIGFDEAYTIGKNDKCRGQSAAKLYAKHLKWCREYLLAKGVQKIIIWHDLLLEAGQWHAELNPHSNGGKYKAITHPALTDINKDVIIDIWSYFHVGSFDVIQYFQKKGFEVLASPWYDRENNIQFAKAAIKNNCGMMGTAWGAFASQSPSSTSVIFADKAWSGKNSKVNYISAKVLQKWLLTPRPSDFAGTKISQLDISKKCNRSLVDQGDGRGWTGEGSNKDMRLLPEGKVNMEGTSFDIIPLTTNNGRQCIAVAGKKFLLPQSIDNITVDRKVLSLIFLHSCNAGINKEKIGEYQINYDDGTHITVPLVNLQNISYNCIPQEVKSLGRYQKYSLKGYLPKTQRVWEGFNYAGENIWLEAYEWRNPHPEKRIQSINLNVVPESTEGMIFLLALNAVTAKADK